MHAAQNQVGNPNDVEAIIIGPIIVDAVELKDELTDDRLRILPDGTALAAVDANGALLSFFDGASQRVVRGNALGFPFVGNAEPNIGTSAVLLGPAGSVLLGPIPALNFTRISVSAFANVAGTITIEESWDAGANFDVVQTIPVAAGVAATVNRFRSASDQVQVRYTTVLAQATFRIKANLRSIA